VETVDGEVIWERSRYVAIARSHRLEAITGSLQLPPGRYTFYRLRGTKYLLSAQSQAGVESPYAQASAPAPVSLEQLDRMVSQPLDFNPRDEPERAVERLRQMKEAAQHLSENPPDGFDRQAAAGLAQRAAVRMKELAQGQNLFDLARLAAEEPSAAPPELDQEGRQQLLLALHSAGLRQPAALDANARGQQTAGQRFSLSRELLYNLAWCAVVVLGGLVAGYLLVKKGDLLSALGVAGFFAFILLILLSSMRAELGDFLSGRVQVEEGWAGKSSQTSRSARGHSVTHYYLQVNENSFEISQVAYSALVEAKYRVYYLPNTRQVVNIDLI
jgi:hypothetical protein